MLDEEDDKESGAPTPQYFHGQSTNVLHRENLYVVRKIFMANQTHRENLVCKTIMVNQSQLMKSVQLVQSNFSYGIENK